MNILLTNDDGYKAKGIRELAGILKQFGDVEVIAPKRHQSGMGMAVSLGPHPIAYKDLGVIDGVRWSYLDATPASCVKFGLDCLYSGRRPDIVVSGINHGSNAASAACYSGTLGAAAEAALNGIPAMGVSLASMNPDADFSAVKFHFPAIFKKIAANLPEKSGIYFNVNFPKLPVEAIAGIRVGHQGMGHWEKEFVEWNPEIYKKKGLSPEHLSANTVPALEKGEKAYMMVGDFVDDKRNTTRADHRLNNEGFISIVAHHIDSTEYNEKERLIELGFDANF